MSNGQIVLPPSDLPIEGYVWLQDIGRVNFAGSGYAGTRGESRRMEGFQLDLVDPPGQLAIQYQVYASNIGWMPVVDGGQYAGTKDRGLGLQAFRIKLLNPAIEPDGGVYCLQYMTHQQDNGDVSSPWADTDGMTIPYDGDGSGLRLEGLAVTVIHLT